MLQQLLIKNIAIIDELEISLYPGLNIITGETGAGKSIVISALDLVLGGRASAESVRAGEDKARVEAQFDLKRLDSVKAVLSEYGLENDTDGQLILRRQIAQAGKSSGYVNGSLVPLWELEKVGERLVDIHGQHQHQLLLNPATHLDFLDALGGLLPQCQELSQIYSQWQARRDELQRLTQENEAKKQRRQLLEFQLQEIDQANLRENEEGELRAERQILLNAGRLTEYGQFIYQNLYEAEGAVLDVLAQVQEKLKSLAGIDPSLAPHVEVAESVNCQLQDLAMEVNRYLGKVEHNPDRLQATEERLAEIEKLERKYGKPLGSVSAFRDQAALELQSIGQTDERIEQISQEQQVLTGQLNQLALELSARRKDTSQRLEGLMSAELNQLGMPKAQFLCSLSPVCSSPIHRGHDSPMNRGTTILGRGQGEEDGVYTGNSQGIDQVEFLFSANPGEPPRPLAKIASGGELSRIMLALKTLLAEGDQVATLVFDEVDTGIGGTLAAVVGRKLRALAASRQVICITHLPEIAALADHHYSVAKGVADGRTQIQWKKLDKTERIEELARMLAGEEITDTARQHAREMMG